MKDAARSSAALLREQLMHCTNALQEERNSSMQFMGLVRHQLSQPITALRCGLEVSAQLPLNETQLRQRMMELVNQVDRLFTALEALEALSLEKCGRN